MKVNAGKLLMAVAIVLMAWLLWSMPSFGQPLVNPVLDHLDQAKVSYIAKMEGQVLVIYLIKGAVDLDQLADIANVSDVRVEIRDLGQVK